jgi:hypothetical protein
MRVTRDGRLDIPDSLRQKFLDFRRRVWAVKLTEAAAGAAAGVLAGYLLTFALDRFLDTPRPARAAIFLGAAAACGLVPLALHRWVWGRRRLDQLARLLGRRHPSVGDQLLGIIELSQNDSEQARSPALVEAAIRQVSAEAERRDFRDAVPSPKHRRRLWTAGSLAAAAVVTAVAAAPAARNAWARFLAPWADTPRYTFAAVDPLPPKVVVPHGEPFVLSVTPAGGAVWRPARAELSLPGRPTFAASLEDGVYRFELPPQLDRAAARLKVGDYDGRTEIEPMLRPELSGLTAEVTLPGYLGRAKPLRKDIRGGALTAVRGSRAEFVATVSRDLASAAVDARPRKPDGPRFATGPVAVNDPGRLRLDWRDRFGLTGKQPFVVSVTGVEDETPSLVCENLPRQKVLLDSEVVAFQVRARDDFGVKRVGIEWAGLDPTLPDPAEGERVIGAGGTEAESLELAATFAATEFGIAPQPVAVRVFVEDYLPGRERVYSPACRFDVLGPEDHAVWIAAQLGRWHKLALEVRDRELQLHETNQELRGLPQEEIETPQTRRRIEAQAAAERANARRLTALTAAGDELLKQAMRNPEVGVGHLERWAEMMRLLKDIAGNRMPSVADLLRQAATEKVAQNDSGDRRPHAGRNLLDQSGGSVSGKTQPKQTAAVPAVTDVESSLNPPKPGEPKPPSEGKGSQPRLTLPKTMLAGNGSGDRNPPPPPRKVDAAVQEQQDLLAEFDKIADELNEVLANLEGSTLVKRLKAASRRQQQVATKLGSMVGGAFGAPAGEAQAVAFGELSEVESSSSRDASDIMDDMAAFFDRSKYARFKVVLDDMREQDVTAGLRDLGEDLSKETGLSVSQAEYWGETFDRWAEDLVEVTKCGACPGCKAKGSLPPSVVLEVLQILEGEVNLREETRVAGQARAAVTADEHAAAGGRLSEAQDTLRGRTDKVVARIREIPDGGQDFAKEIALLGRVSGVMAEAKDILARPETGGPAIAAETEAIELLLQSKRFNPKAGGGGGPNPGGGGGGDAHDSALALVGTGVNEKEVRQNPGTRQATGSSGPALPEEFRAGLDEYFNRLEEGRR